MGLTRAAWDKYANGVAERGSRMKSCIVTALALGILFTPGARAEEDCRLHLMTSLPMNALQTGRVAVDAAIGDHPLRLLVDTGSPSSTLTQHAVETLGLKEHAVTAGVRIRMFGGEKLTSYVRVTGFRLGRLTAPWAEFLVMENRRDEFDGILGGDFISQFDVDFDFANAKLNLFQPHPCEGKAVYWTQDETAIAKIPFTMEQDERHILIPILVDGRKIKAIVDTGASRSTMNFETASWMFDLEENSPGVRAMGDPQDPVYTYPFKTLTFAGVTVNNPEIMLFPRDKSHFNDYRALLGITILRRLHLYIAYKEHLLYVTAADAH